MGGVVVAGSIAVGASGAFPWASRPIAISSASAAAAAALGIAVIGLAVLAAIQYGRRRDAASGEPEPDSAVRSSDAASEAGAVAMDDTERIETLLREHDGRMHQSAIVEETEWSKSKVSMLLSDMEDAGEISKLRIGRENLINLPGHEPDAVRSPHDE